MSRRVWWILALAPLCVAADEAADRAAIGQAISSLNRPVAQALLFTSDSDALPAFQKLLSGKKLTYSVLLNAGAPKVVISSEPWGEAQIVFPGPITEVSNPRFVSGAIRFVSEDVALVEASLVERTGEERQSTPLLFVMKKDGADWRIASLRLLR